MGVCGAKRMVLVCVCLKVCACVVTAVSIYTINTRDEFSNVSVTDEYAALSRDSYAMSHLSAVNLACTYRLVYVRPSVFHKPVFYRNGHIWDQVNNVARQVKGCSFPTPKTLAKFQ